MAQRMIGYAQARRAPAADGFRGADRGGRACRRPGARRRPALSVLSRAILAASGRRHGGDARPAARTGSSNGSSTAFARNSSKRGESWRLWSRGEELISDAYPDLEPLARALPPGVAARRRTRRDDAAAGRRSPDSLDGLKPFASLQQRLGRKVVSDKTMRELPVAFIAYDLLEIDGHDMRAEPQHERRAKLERLVEPGARRGEGAASACRCASARVVAARRLGGAGGASARRRARSAARA